jgi:hypothetical protein
MMCKLGLLWAMVILGAACGSGIGAVPATAHTPRTDLSSRQRGRSAAGDSAPVLLAVGDIADCRSSGDEATAAVIRRLRGTIATLGDNVYRSGSAREYEDCYGPTWGMENARTRPVPGNHEYGTPRARGFFGYFGAASGDHGTGYYSYDLGAWHVVALNSNCEAIGGCTANSAQGQWLRAELARHPATCTLAYWHHPLFSSGKTHGGDAAMRPIWKLLYAAGADVVLSGHEHNYERFAPQDPGGLPDPARGIREFVVGTGGESHYGFGKPLPTSERRNADTYGVLALTLHPTGYDWAFVPAGRGGSPRNHAFTDNGSGTCH